MNIFSVKMPRKINSDKTCIIKSYIFFSITFFLQLKYSYKKDFYKKFRTSSQKTLVI